MSRVGLSGAFGARMGTGAGGSSGAAAEDWYARMLALIQAEDDELTEVRNLDPLSVPFVANASAGWLAPNRPGRIGQIASAAAPPAWRGAYAGNVRSTLATATVATELMPLWDTVDFRFAWAMRIAAAVFGGGSEARFGFFVEADAQTPAADPRGYYFSIDSGGELNFCRRDAFGVDTDSTGLDADDGGLALDVGYVATPSKPFGVAFAISDSGLLWRSELAAPANSVSATHVLGFGGTGSSIRSYLERAMFVAPRELES